MVSLASAIRVFLPSVSYVIRFSGVFERNA